MTGTLMVVLAKANDLVNRFFWQLRAERSGRGKSYSLRQSVRVSLGPRHALYLRADWLLRNINR